MSSPPLTRSAICREDVQISDIRERDKKHYTRFQLIGRDIFVFDLVALGSDRSVYTGLAFPRHCIYTGKKLEEQLNVIVKIIPVASDAEYTSDPEKKRATKRIIREAHLMSHCAHNNVVELLDAFTNSNREVCIVMEQANGSLEDIFGGKMSADGGFKKHINETQFQLAYALEHLRNKRVAHRDIKPGNILVFNHPGVMTVKSSTMGPRYENLRIPYGFMIKIADFGSATETMLGKDKIESPLIGTGFYSAPEAAFSARLSYTINVDLWSAGALLYRMVEKREPLSREEYGQLGYSGRLPVGYELPASCTASRDIRTLVKGLLVVSPDKRMKFNDFYFLSLVLVLHTAENLRKVPDETMKGVDDQDTPLEPSLPPSAWERWCHKRRQESNESLAKLRRRLVEVKREAEEVKAELDKVEEELRVHQKMVAKEGETKGSMTINLTWEEWNLVADKPMFSKWGAARLEGSIIVFYPPELQVPEVSTSDVPPVQVSPPATCGLATRMMRMVVSLF